MCLWFKNSDFNSFGFSSDANIFPDENVNSFFTKFNCSETPFRNADHPVSLDSTYLEINDLYKLNIDKH